MNVKDQQSENYIPGGTKVFNSLLDAEREKRRDNLFFLIVAFVALCIMLVIVSLNTYVFFIAQVNGRSMQPTLYTDDRLVANRYKKANVGDIVCIDIGMRENGNKVFIIKRIIAVGGQTVEIKDGYVYVDDKKIDEPYLEQGCYTDARDWQKYTLKDDEIFYLGDNRPESSDARDKGVCKISNIAGVIEGWSLWLNSL